MGIFFSRIGSYMNTLMMNTDTMIHFRDEMQRQMTTAQAAGQMTTIQQAGIGQGGVGGGGSAAAAWGGGSWYAITTTFNQIAIVAVPLGIAISVVTSLMKGSQLLMFGAVFMTVFFAIERFLYSIQWGKAGIVTGQNLLISLFLASVVGAFVGFAVYQPEEASDMIPDLIIDDNPNRTETRRSIRYP